MRKFCSCYPGAGVGGHCLLVDLFYPVKKVEEMEYDSTVITGGRAINDYRALYMLEPSVSGELVGA